MFQYKCPVDSRPGDPNHGLLNHRSGILFQKRALESDIRRHYTGHDTFRFMAGVETLKGVHTVCRLQVDPSSTFTWGTDCCFDKSGCQVMAELTVWMPLMVSTAFICPVELTDV